MAQYSTPNIQFRITNITDGNSYDIDVEKVTDFPLALTYSIKDVQDPNSSKGSYSKTFSIPATGHNNIIFKSLFSESLYDAHQYVENYDCDIFVDGMSVLQGKFQIKGTKYKGVPRSYECQVFGENYKWVNAMSELNLCDIDFTAGNFFPHAPVIAIFEREDIMNTWEFGVAGEILTQGGVPTQTHMVYPLVNTGKWNTENSGGEGIVTPSDMSPAFYFYNMLHCMFAMQGYTLVSNFVETDWFKRLVSYIPLEDFVNNDDIIVNYSFDYDSSASGCSYVTPWKTPLHYHNTSGTQPNCAGVVGNEWHGQSQGLCVACPTCDPSGQVITDDITPFILTGQGGSFDVDANTSVPAFHLAGWYGFNYSLYNNNGGSQPYHTPWTYMVNPCQTTPPTSLSSAYPWRNYGFDWFCIDCDPWYWNGINIPYPSPYTNSYEQPFTDTTMFATTYLGIYEFSGSMTLEMSNEYECANDVAAYDPWCGHYQGNSWYPPSCGTTRGGADFVPVQPSPANAAVSIYTGTVYDFNLYLMHYEAATGVTHTVHGEQFRHRNTQVTQIGTFPHQFFNDTDQLCAWDDNLEATLSFSGVQIDILSPDDRVFLYGEVTACGMVGNGDTADEHDAEQIQMKYRAKHQAFSGTIDPLIIAGGSVDLELLLPCDTTMLDWVNGLTGLFNLHWQSDEVTKTVYVEPRDSFFNPITEAIDWTDKLDHGTTQQNNYIYDSLKRNVCFTYENDSADEFVSERNRRRGQICELGSHSMNLGELYVNDEQRIGSDYYSPTYMFYDKTVSNNTSSGKQPFIPVIHQEYSPIWSATLNADLPDRLVEFAPRILTWYGLQPLNQDDGATAANTWRWGDDGVTNTWDNRTTYPFAGVYSDQVGNLGGTLTLGSQVYDAPSLYFENSEINVVPTPPPYDLTQGLYRMFWEYHILNLITRPIIKIAYFKLTEADISDLNFRNLIYLKTGQADTYWILNKITDYKAGKNVVTKVELFEFANTMPVKPSGVDDGFGANLTPQWSDHNEPLVAHGVIKVPDKYLTSTSNLHIGNQSMIPRNTNHIQNTSVSGYRVSATNNIRNTQYTGTGNRVPSQLGTLGGNIGNNANIGSGGISIGNNINQTNAGQITIGDGNNPFSKNPIQFTQNGKTVLAISSAGRMLEGGGGCVYFENAAGQIQEVMTGVPYLTRTGYPDEYTYTRVLLSDPADDIISNGS